MAIEYVGGQTAGRTNPSSAVSVNFALTGGLASVPADGDLVIVTCVTGSAAGNPAMAVTTPATYTALGQLNQSAVTADTSMNVSYKRMTSTPDTAVTIPGTGNNAFGEAYAIQVFRGVDASTPMDVTAVSGGGTGTGRPNPNAITPVTTGAWVVICGGGAAGTGATYTAPANYTTDFVTSSGADSTDAMVGCGYWTGWTSGEENPAAYTGGTTGANDSWTSYTIALRPVTLTATRGRISFSELEAPFVSTRGRISFGELEVPLTPTRGRVSFAEFEAPIAPTMGRLSFSEFEVPTAGTPTRGLVSFAELETPFVGTKGRISFSELEVPTTLTRGRISFSELEIPFAPTRGRVSYSELEVPALPTRGLVSFAELEIPSLGSGGYGWCGMSGLSAYTGGGDMDGY